MMSDMQRSAVVAAIYQSLLWPEGWGPALHEMQSMFCADHVYLTVAGQPTLSGTTGVDLSVVAELYQSVPTFAQAVKAVAGNGRATQWQEIYPDRPTYERSDAYQKLVRPLGGYHGLLVVDDESRIGLAICRAPLREDYDRSMRRELDALHPHLRAAREIADRFGAVQDSNRSLARLISCAREAVVLTDASARVVMMNDAAHQAVASARCRYAEGDLIATDAPETTFALRAAIAAAAHGSHHGHNGDGNGRWLALTDARGVPRHFARILAFAPAHYGLDDAGTARVAVFIKDAVSPRSLDRTALYDLFHLTPREADVACLLVGGHTAQDIAVALGLSMPTVRTHLARIFEKTGTRNQATLVALVGRFET